MTAVHMVRMPGKAFQAVVEEAELDLFKFGEKAKIQQHGRGRIAKWWMTSFELKMLRIMVESTMVDSDKWPNDRERDAIRAACRRFLKEYK